MKTVKVVKMLTLVAGILALAACSGAGTTVPTSGTTRSITGTLPSGAPAALFKAANHSNCAADSVIATDTTGETEVGSIEHDCSFELELTIGRSYVISFTADGAFVATLIFDSGVTGFSDSVMGISDGDDPIGLGTITISGNTATSANNPLDVLDQDGDGTLDSEDRDDDDDGIDDEDEGDCDLDGYLDDHDDDDCDEDADGDRILRVKPANHSDDVDLDKDVRVKASCTIDQTSVTADSFSVVSAEGDAIACTYEFMGEGTGSMVRCRHHDNPFVANTVYTATVSGMRCEGGSELVEASWSFTTEEADDDEGDAEDDIDDEDAEEEEEDDDLDEDEGEEDEDEDDNDEDDLDEDEDDDNDEADETDE